MANEKSIDVAINDLREQIESHRSASKKILFYVMYFVSLLLVFGVMIFVYQDYRAMEFSNSIGAGAYISTSSEKDTNNQTPPVTTNIPTSGGEISVGVGSGYAPNTTVLYVFVILFVVVFGVMMAVYRFHLSEISRSEQLKVGFMRIRIAANNIDKEGFQTDVRHSLTHEAFQYQTGKEKKVESPLPGHPSSDIGTLLVNKLIDNIDLKVKDKSA